MWRLGGGPHRDPAALHLGQASVRFKWDVLDGGTAKRIFEDVVRPGESLVDIALAQLEVVADVAVGLGVDDQVGKCGAQHRRRIMDQRSSISERLEWIEYSW